MYAIELFCIREQVDKFIVHFAVSARPPFDTGPGAKPELRHLPTARGGGQVKLSMDPVGIRPAITRNGGNDAARRDGRPSGQVRPGQYPGGAVPFW